MRPVVVDPARKEFEPVLARAHADGSFVTGYTLGDTPVAGAPIIAALDRYLRAKKVIVTDAFPFAAAHGRRSRYYGTSAVPNVRAAIEALLAAIASSDGTRSSVVSHLLARPGIDRWGDPRTAPVAVLRLPAGRRDGTITP